MSHSRLGSQSWTGKVVARIDSPGPAAAAPALYQPAGQNPHATRQRRIDRQAQAEGRQFENARITS